MRRSLRSPRSIAAASARRDRCRPSRRRRGSLPLGSGASGLFMVCVVAVLLVLLGASAAEKNKNKKKKPVRLLPGIVKVDAAVGPGATCGADLGGVRPRCTDAGYRGVPGSAPATSTVTG